MVQNKKEYQLNIDPRILELLGPNLYTNIYYVLAELIANAYDANARNVYIISDKNFIAVEDDGSGMSYEDGDIDNFLNVAKETRTTQASSEVPGSDGMRIKMGRKGVGKLAALSVSENVKIKTVKNGEKSGFVLSRKIGDDHKLIPIPEDEIEFNYISSHGTSIVMTDPQYDLHKTIDATKKNLLRIFPLVNEDFRIHLKVGKKTETIESYEDEIINGLACLITLGDEFSHLHSQFDSKIPKLTDKQKSELGIKRDAQRIILNNLKNRNGDHSSYALDIKGWIGAYQTTKGRKKNQVDFPDNFISLISNKKMGEFNILPVVGKNALSEVYVVGQLHVDLFEHSDLPDMALSNRQGYKSDDRRYIEATKYIRDTLLPEVINMRAKFTAFKKHDEELTKSKRKQDLELALRKNIDAFKMKASSDAAKNISRAISSNEAVGQSTIESVISKAINSALPDMGIKSKVDANKKRLLISHASKNKSVSDFVFKLLVYAGVPAESVIYTSNDDAITRIPESEGIYEYLRKFFVNSYSTEKIYILYLTSNEMAASWACVSEVGAGWIVKSEHNIFSINSYSPKQPLDVNREWACIDYSEENDSIGLTARAADVLAEKVFYICNFLGYRPRDKSSILNEIKNAVLVE